MRLRTVLAAAVATAPLAVLSLASAAHAAPPAQPVATTSITGQPDTGFGGNTWATDSITRTAAITSIEADLKTTDCGSPAPKLCYWYHGSLTDTGTAHAIAGQTSPGVQAVPIKGSPSASITGAVYVSFFASSAAPDATLVPTHVTGNTKSDADWLEQFFPAGTDFGASPDVYQYYAKYTDAADCQTWFNAATIAKASSGDITGVFSCPVLSHGAAAVSATRATVSWRSTVTSTFEVQITGPGPLDGRLSRVTRPQAVYAGLESGHTYSVTIQPLVNGVDEGKAGRITFITAK